MTEPPLQLALQGIYPAIILTSLLACWRFARRVILPTWRRRGMDGIAAVAVGLSGAMSLAQHGLENAWYWPARLWPAQYGWLHLYLPGVLATKLALLAAAVVALAATGLHPGEGEAPGRRFARDIARALALGAVLWGVGIVIAVLT